MLGAGIIVGAPLNWETGEKSNLRGAKKLEGEDMAMPAAVAACLYGAIK